MKKMLALLIFIPIISFAKEPIVSHPETLSLESSEVSEFEIKVLVGKERSSTVKDQIKRKALLLGLSIEMNEKFHGWQDELKIQIKPSVDQQQDVKDFKSFIKDL